MNTLFFTFCFWPFSFYWFSECFCCIMFSFKSMISVLRMQKRWNLKTTMVSIVRACTLRIRLSCCTTKPLLYMQFLRSTSDRLSFRHLVFLCSFYCPAFDLLVFGFLNPHTKVSLDLCCVWFFTF